MFGIAFLIVCILITIAKLVEFGFWSLDWIFFLFAVALFALLIMAASLKVTETKEIKNLDVNNPIEVAIVNDKNSYIFNTEKEKLVYPIRHTEINFISSDIPKIELITREPSAFCFFFGVYQNSYYYYNVYIPSGVTINLGALAQGEKQ